MNPKGTQKEPENQQAWRKEQTWTVPQRTGLLLDGISIARTTTIEGGGGRAVPRPQSYAGTTRHAEEKGVVIGRVIDFFFGSWVVEVVCYRGSSCYWVVEFGEWDVGLVGGYFDKCMDKGVVWSVGGCLDK